MDTDLLETFRQVARDGSISGAARGLAYTQSAVSRQVAVLEAEFGARLFDRHAGGVRLTEHGRRLLTHAESLLERLDLARHDLEALDRLEDGRLRIGAFPTANASLVPRAMAGFAAEWPNVSLSLVEGNTRRQLARLESGDADLAVVSAFPDQTPDRKRFDLVTVLDDSMLIAVPVSHRLAGRRRVRLTELENETWIGGELADDDDHALGPARLATAPPSDFPVREWTAKLGLVAAGLGSTLVPALAAGAARSDIALVRIDHRDAPPRTVFAATPRGVTAPPATDAFIAALMTSAKQLADAVASRPD